MARFKYETNVKDKLILVEGWARNGLTDEQIVKDNCDLYERDW